MHAYTLFFIVGRKEKKAVQPSVMISLAVSTLFFEDTDREIRCLTSLWISEDSQNQYLWGFCFTTVWSWSYYASILCYIDFGWFVKMYRTLSIVQNLMPIDFFSRVSLDQSLYHVAAFNHVNISSLLSSGVKWDKSHYTSI